MTPRQGTRVLVVNGDLPTFPGRAGHEFLHTTGLARLGPTGLVSMLHTREQAARLGPLRDAGVELFLWESPSLASPEPAAPATRPPFWRRFAKPAYTLLRTWPERPRDTQLQDLQLRNMAAALLRALLARRWDAMVVVQSQCAHWIDHVPRPPLSVLVLHDVRALVHERRAAHARTSAERLEALAEAAIYRRFEGAYCEKYDLVVTVSSADEEWVRAHYAPRRLVTIPIPVDAAYFARDPALGPEPGRLVFTGMMDHPPNVDAACFFAQEVLPRVRSEVPDAEFWIVGRDPAPRVRALAAEPGVVVTGGVPDIRPHIARASVIVVPLRYGAGMRNKILEAWAMEKCVVSTRVGAEGLDARDGESLLFADSAEELASRCAAALRDDVLRARLEAAGRALVLEQHDPAQLAQRYRAALDDALCTKRKTAAPMRATIDLRWMRPGVAGGIENLSRSFLSSLLALDRVNRYDVLVPAGVARDFDLRDHDNVRIVAADGPAALVRRALWKGAGRLHRAARIDYWRSPEVEALRSAASHGADVVLSMSGYIAHELFPCRNLLVVHDLQHEYHPEFFPGPVLEERRRVFGDSILKADHLVAVSEHTRRTVIEKFGIDPARITTVHEAADPIFEPERARGVDVDAVLAKYGLPKGRYFFFPAHTWPHKNHAGALDALARVPDALLVCTGSPKEAMPAILERIDALGLRARVRFLGYSPLADMPALYRGAAALLYPSYFEGFGIPLVEAMWSGCPIVCSNRTSLPEVAGDAALLFEPSEPEAIADAMERVLGDAALRTELVEKGRSRARDFTWRKFTTEIVRLLHHTRDL